ncbi:MAG: Ger(x)C family spore germination protein [Bacillota bacterium]|nr:Ger(x)C family spore germination protein [Bacillota bacterium]
MKKIILIFTIVLLIFPATGCKETKQELNKLSIVVAQGFDLTPDGKYLLSVQVLNPQKEPSGGMSGKMGGGQQTPSEVLVFSSIGDTPRDALTRFSTETGKNLFFGHTKYVLIGKDLAQSGITFLLDELLRGYESRPDNVLLVTKGSAFDIINAKTAVDKVPSETVENLLRLQTSKGYVTVTSRLDFANAVSRKTMAPTMGVIDLVKNTNTDATFKISGTAVFKKGKLIGFLDMNQTRGMQWVKGGVQNGYIASTIHGNNKVSFHILRSKSKITPIITGNTIKMQITINEQGNLVELQETLDPMKDYRIMDELSLTQNKAIKSEVNLALYAAQEEFKADIFDFGGIIHRENPSYWNKIQKDWDNIFPNIKVEVKVNSSVKRPGVISKPIK